MRTALTLGLVAVGTAAFATAPDGRPVLNSFVDRKVADTRQLLAHVRADAVVADRYERHFSMSRREVLGFLATLHRAPLSRAGVFTIYSVPKGGRLKMHVGRIAKGEPMFMDRAGRPVLVVRCGNPVVLGPRRGRKTGLLTGLTAPVGLRSLVLEAGPDPLVLNESTVAALPSLPEVDGIDQVVTLLPPSASVGVSPIGGGGWKWGSLLLLLPILGQGHGPAGSPPTKITPVPEPAAFLPLGMGVAAMARRRRRRS